PAPVHDRRDHPRRSRRARLAPRGGGVMTRLIPAPRPATATTAIAAMAALAATAGYLVGHARLHRALATERHRATHDPLTGLLNRAGLHDAWSGLAPAPAGVALLDLDGFRPVNDTHGHAAGDHLLVTIAGRLR